MKVQMVLIGALGLVCVAVMPPHGSAWAASPTTMVSGNRPRLAEIAGEIKDASAQLKERFPSRFDLLDEERRAEITEHALPNVKRLTAAYNELAKLNLKSAERANNERVMYLTILASWDDAEAAASLEEVARSKDSSLALKAAAGRLAARWMQARHLPEKQIRILEAMHALAKAHADNDGLVPLLMMMYRHGAASKELRDGVVRIVTDDLEGAKARQLASQLKKYSGMRALEGKPLTLAGVTLNGEPFSTAKWKDKVILVDFWATWCAPCRMELPHLKSLYAKYHDKGLEIVGVSCDEETEALRTFLAGDKDMPWPQLFDIRQPGWHVLANQCNVHALPAVFLIDKTGVLLATTAMDELDGMIAKLLAEPSVPSGSPPEVPPK